MSVRELVALGTAAQVPTRERNHNGYLLRWDQEAVLFDPGEGTQRQLLFAGIAPPSITRICLTHVHGDHCLGLPGVLQRLSLDGVSHPIDLHYPASAHEHVERLRHGSIHHDRVEVRTHPDHPGVVAEAPPFRLIARALDHRIDTLGWRIEEPAGRTLLPDRLAELGIEGPAVGELRRTGQVTRAGRTIHLEDVSAPRPGQSFAFVMDTRWCDAALELADGVDLLVCEATFLDRDRELADRYAHLTAAQAGQLAAEAGVGRLVLTHLSQRYQDPEEFRAEAARYVEDVHVAADLDRVPLPPRSRPFD